MKYYRGRSMEKIIPDLAFGKGNFEDIREIRVADVDFENATFSGYYISPSGSTVFRTNQKISDYTFYDIDTCVGEEYIFNKEGFVLK